MNLDTIYGCFRLQAMYNPGGRAIFDDSRTLTYAELDAMVNTIISRFPTIPMGNVGIVMDHSVEMIAAILAVLKCGAAYVPIEPSMPDARIDFVLSECDAEFVITNSNLRGRFGDRLTLPLDRGLKIDTAVRYPDLSTPQGHAYILYTSGSTGLPKGVSVTNANVCHYVRAFRNEFHPTTGDVMLQYSVCTFDIFVEEVFSTLLSGAALAIAPEKVKKNIRRLMRYVERQGVTIISGFPYLLLEINKLGRLPKCVRLLISGGDVLRYTFIDRLLPLTTIYNSYGPSETTVCCSYQCANEVSADKDGTYPIGKPVAGTQMLILDEQLRLVPDGEPGEICIMGGGVSDGYIGNRKIENLAFVTLPDGRRLYRSGDLGIRNADGSFRFLHRKDKQVMILGKRVETCEVENVLLQCPEIESGTVQAQTDSMGLSFLTAYIVPKLPKSFNLSTLKRKMAQFLPTYMIPEFFVQLKSIPLTPNGKVNANALPHISKTAVL